MDDRLLGIELKVLIIRYGAKRVESALRNLQDVNVEAIESELRDLPSKRNLPSRRAPSIESLIRDLFADRKEAEISIRRILENFSERKFLPERRDAQRFLEKLNIERTFKSRNDAIPLILQVLSRNSDAELAELAKSSANARSEDYALLARQIMGR